MTDDLDSLRRRLRTTLPVSIHTAVGAYERFMAEEPPADAKGFAVWHGAAKAALAHVDLLVKLARWAEGKEDESADPGSGLDRLLADARTALDGFDDEEE